LKTNLLTRFLLTEDKSLKFQLAAGKHRIPFSFKLPTQIPPS